VLFELLDALAERGRRERDGMGGTAKIEGRGGFEEAAQAVERWQGDHRLLTAPREWKLRRRVRAGQSEGYGQSPYPGEA
jgi:hypothetical protein